MESLNFTLVDISRAVSVSAIQYVGFVPEHPSVPVPPYRKFNEYVNYVVDIAKKKAKDLAGEDWVEPLRLGRQPKKYGREQVAAILDEINEMTTEPGSSRALNLHLVSVNPETLRNAEGILFNFQ